MIPLPYRGGEHHVLHLFEHTPFVGSNSISFPIKRTEHY